MSYVDPYELALKELLQVARNTKIQTIELEQLHKEYRKLTIDNFLNLLYNLFELENMSIKDGEELGPNQRDRFFYTEVYPDTFDNTYTNCVVTFEIAKREPTVFATDAIKAAPTKQHRPIYKGVVKDSNGKEAILYEKHYTNYIKFTVWSEKAEDARRVASLLENFFTKHYQNLRMYIGHMLYEGRGSTVVSNNHGSKRLFGVPLVYNIRTEEPGFIRHGDIVSIDTYGNVVDSLLQNELKI